MRKIWSTRRALAAAAVAALSVATVTPAKAADPVTITIWTFGDVIQRNFVQEYKLLHPEVSLDIKKSDLDPLNGTNMVTACTAHNGPDLVAVEVSYSGYWRSYPSCFQDLRQMKTSSANAAASSVVPASSNIAANRSAVDMKKDYLPWRRAQGVAYNGNVIGIPTDVGGLEVAYRTELFKKAGLPTDRVKVGKLWPTWDKFIATGQQYLSKLSAKDKKAGKGFIDNSGTIYAAMLNQGTSKYYLNDGTDQGKLIYSTNKAVKSAWDETIKALNAGIGTRIGQFSSDWNTGMSNGTFATILAPAWMMDYIKAQAPDTKGKWDIADMPGGGGNQGGTQLSIPSYAKNKQAAFDFMSWYLAPAQQLRMFKTYGLFPSTPSVYPQLKDYKDPFFNNAPVGKIYASGIVQLKPIFEGKLERAIDTAFGAGLSRVAAKKMSPAKSWAQVMSDLQKVVSN
jgi:cellobiose transport system substrate-binding protein